MSATAALGCSRSLPGRPRQMQHKQPRHQDRKHEGVHWLHKRRGACALHECTPSSVVQRSAAANAALSRPGDAATEAIRVEQQDSMAPVCSMTPPSHAAELVCQHTAILA